MTESDDNRRRRSVWSHIVAAGDRFADMMVDISAIVALAYIAVIGVPNGLGLEAAQILGAMITSIAIGKRYFQSKGQIDSRNTH